MKPLKIVTIYRDASGFFFGFGDKGVLCFWDFEENELSDILGCIQIQQILKPQKKFVDL
jgi:hypothetical protein